MTDDARGDQQIGRIALERILAGPEMLRGRARSVATMMATAAGALAAGLVFSDFSKGLSVFPTWLGLACLLFLVLSVALFVAASLYVEVKAKPPTMLSKGSSEPARDTGVPPKLVTESIAAANNISDRIATRTRWGSAFGGLGAAAFFLMAIAGYLMPHTSSVHIELPKGSAWKDSGLCSALPLEFDAEVAAVALSGSEEMLPLIITGETCTGTVGASQTIFVLRTEALIVG